MKNRVLCNSDGDFLILPQTGELTVKTEFGIMTCKPGEICVIQRGIKFSVDVSGPSRGYVGETFSGHFELPERGPIGANSLANERDFETPVAYYEDIEGEFELLQKFQGKLFTASLDHSPFDVVGWHGNYAPYKYDLSLFCAVNSVTFDHPDPSIYTVLTVPSSEKGVAIFDFVIFPPRWIVQENTFRPPWYHRNTMSEYMGLITGEYDAKKQSKDGKKGFVPGGSSLHNTMIAHGPGTDILEKQSTIELKPVKIEKGSLAFMFESTYSFSVTKYALGNKDLIDEDYAKSCWGTFKKTFNVNKK